MKWHKFDKTLQQEMLAHQSEVDINAIWTAIEPELDMINAKQYNKRRGIIWWGLLASLLLLASSWYFLGSTAEEQLDSQAKQAAIASQDMLAKDAPAEPQEATAAMLNTEEKQPVADEATDAITKPVSKGTPSTNSSSTTTKQQAKAPAPLNTQGASLPPVQTKAIPEAIQPTTEKATKLPIASEETSEKVVESAIEPTTSSSDASLSAAKPAKLDAFPAITAKDAKLLDWSDMDLPNYELRPLPGLSSRDGSPYSLDIQLGIAFPFRKLNGPNDTVSSSVLELREQTESPLEALQLGIQLNRQFRSGLEISTGLHFTRITERFDYNTTLTTVDTTNGIVAYHIQLNGDTIPEYGQVLETTQTMVRKEYYNRYQLLDIPILLGYRLEANNFVIGLQAGVMANVALLTKGRILGGPGIDQDIKNSENDLFKSNVTFSYYFSFMTAYEIMPGVQLHFAPYAHIYPKSFTGDANQLSQKYTLAGLKAGIRYQF